MNVTPLYPKDSPQAVAFLCGKCKLVWNNPKDAERCCLCSYCGKEIDNRPIRQFSHVECMEAETVKNYEKSLKEAVEVPGDEGFVFCEHGGPRDGYAENIEAMAEWWAEAIANEEMEESDYPEFVLACKPYPPRKIDLGEFIEMASDDGYDGIEDDIEFPDGFKELLEKFNEMNAKLFSWSVDYRRKVRMPPLKG